MELWHLQQRISNQGVPLSDFQGMSQKGMPWTLKLSGWKWDLNSIRMSCHDIAKLRTFGAGVASAVLAFSFTISSSRCVCEKSFSTSPILANDKAWSGTYLMGVISIQFSSHVIDTCPEARHWSAWSCINSGTSTCDGFVACNIANNPTNAWVSAIELPTPMLACLKDLGRITGPVTPIAKIASTGCR